MKICIKCKKDKDLKDFNKNKNHKDGLQKYCKECKKGIDIQNRINNEKKWKENNIKRNQKINLKLRELKLENGGKCKKCPENRLHVLEFHHINPENKINQISNLLNFYGKGNWNIIEEEVKKCILLCSNCHKDFHYNNRLYNIDIDNYLKK